MQARKNENERTNAQLTACCLLQGKDNPGARAALLSGVPGVGKSSTATLVAREMGYHVMELNASDTRSKRSLAEELSSVIDNKVDYYKLKSYFYISRVYNRSVIQN